MLRAVLAILRDLGFQRMILQGGVRAGNPRGIRFYEKNGFVRVGDFRVRELDNHDMVLDLARAALA
jgi:RimJ/RimL family protein N-acetyltransferase